MTKEITGKKQNNAPENNLELEQGGGLSEKRQNFCIGFVGTNRTGKSITARKVADKWKANNPDGTVISFDPQDRFRDITDVFIHVGMSNDEIYNVVLYYEDALIILDDYKLIHPKERSTERWLLELMHFRSEYNIDIIYITHNPSLIVKALTFYTTHYFIFYTQSQMGDWNNKIPNYVLCRTGSKYINHYVKKHGRGEYPNFPHVIAETETERLIAQNMYENE
jgi:hypothetical protein